MSNSSRPFNKILKDKPFLDYFFFFSYWLQKKGIGCGRRDLNPSYKLGKQGSTGEKQQISKNDFEKYIVRRDIEGLSTQWQGQCTQWLSDYLDVVSWTVDEDRTLAYYKQLKETSSITYYRKKVYQIRKFLEYLKVEWAITIKLPPEPEYLPKRVSLDAIQEILSHFQGHQFFKQIKAIIFLGCSSGMRAEELYQLTPNDIDLENRIVRINHDPENGQTTKTQRSRISFFNVDAQKALSEYLEYFNDGNELKVRFCQSHLSRIFKDSPVKIKDFRKFFSQEWDRRGGPTSIKKILMGHSLKGDVDLMHYNCQSEEDLKKIYDKVMCSIP
jgi:integrase